MSSENKDFGLNSIQKSTFSKKNPILVHKEAILTLILSRALHPKCYIPSPKVIRLLVPEKKIFFKIKWVCRPSGSCDQNNFKKKYYLIVTSLYMIFEFNSELNCVSIY